MPRGEVAVMIDRLVSEMAVKEVQERTFLIRQMIDTGSLAPDVITSTGGTVAIEYIQQNSYPNIRTKLGEILDDLELKQRTLNRTTVTLLNRASELKSSGGAKQPGRDPWRQRLSESLGGQAWTDNPILRCRISRTGNRRRYKPHH